MPCLGACLVLPTVRVLAHCTAECCCVAFWRTEHCWLPNTMLCVRCSAVYVHKHFKQQCLKCLLNASLHFLRQATASAWHVC
jgi:hypothetical protein